MTKQQENEQVPGMREQRFGIEIELTGLTRRAAADIIGDYMGQGGGGKSHLQIPGYS